MLAGDGPAPRGAWVLINECADIIQQLRGVLDFVENDGRPQLIEKGSRVAAHTGPEIGIFQQDIPGVWKEFAQQGCLAGTTRSGK